MLDDGQLQYIEDVLGVPASHFTFEADEPAAGPAIDVLVMTPELSPDQEALLKKILASVKLNNYTHAEVNAVHLGELPEGLVARHVIAFNDEHNGRSTGDENTVWWSLPSLAGMIGEGPEVTANKKEAWNFLQQFAQEMRS
jgi:hypothetical protein